MKPKLFLLCVVIVGVGQIRGLAQSEISTKARFVSIPREVAFPVVAFQPDCPLQFENVILLARPEGGGDPSFRLRNRGIKPIQAATFAMWTSAGGGSTGNWSGKTTSQLVMPGQLVPLSEEEEREIIPLTKELREKMQLNGPMKAVVVFMVLRVEFSDGTVYSDEQTFKSLEKYLNGLAGFKD